MPSQITPDALICDPQQSLASRPYALPAVPHCRPPHMVQPVVQQTEPLPTPGVPSGHVGPAVRFTRRHAKQIFPGQSKRDGRWTMVF